MKLALGILLALLLAVAAAVVISGFVSPADHVASVTATLDAPIDDVWRHVHEFERYPEWRTDVRSVERLTDLATPLVGTRFREEGSEEPVTLEIVEAEAPRRLVSRIADDTLPFGGQWTFELEPRVEGGTTLRITEKGFVRSFLFRALGPLFSSTATMERWLTHLATSLGEEPRLEVTRKG